ncbi:MAG: tetratricopeptide repeat protein, partial [Ktedonobacterales bacterium]
VIHDEALKQSASPLPGDSLCVCGKVDTELLGQVDAVRGEIAFYRGQFAESVHRYECALTRLPESKGYLRTMIATNLGTVYVTAGQTDAGVRALALARGISETTQNPLAMIGSLCGLGYLQLLQGQLRAAASAFQEALTVMTVRDEALSPMTCMAHVGMGRVRYEWNDVDAATEHFTAALTLSEQWGNTLYLVRSHALLARADLARGDTQAACALLEDLEELRLRAYMPASISALASAMGARLHLALGQIEQAEHWARVCGLTPNDDLSYPHEYGHMTLARVLLALGRNDEAVVFIERLRSVAEAAGRDETVLEARILLARAYHALGDAPTAITLLRGALAQSESEGYIRLFADEGAPIVSLLSRITGRLDVRGPATASHTPSPSPSYVERLRQASRSAPVALGSHAAVAELKGTDQLHARELDIIRLLAVGQSNTQIAGELVVALSTVKWHLANIYGKLGVRSRTQAIARARELRLVE